MQLRNDHKMPTAPVTVWQSRNAPVTIQYCPYIRKAAGRPTFLLRKNVQVFIEGYGDVSDRAAICAIWENGLNLCV